ncbi:MAG: PQQ-binding-like beta-propeller repeat protein, partial [Nitrospinaceae bacterium]|nr:PQQ-binding-like beta-propeller repeat protein [Nitrospinaceae bacterium]
SVWQHDDRYLYDDFIASPAGGDLDGDGELEAVLVDSWGLVIVLDLATGTVEWTKEIGDTVVSSPALADLDGD